MPDVFDPYYTWLGIPKSEQPPNHYRLLAISLYESDADVIANAADRVMAHLRTYQTGRNGPASQQLLREVALARVCLLTPQMKARYDRDLQAKLAARPPSLSDSGGSVLDDDFPPKRSGSALGGTSAAAGASSRKTSGSNPAISASGKQRMPGETLNAGEKVPGAGLSATRRGQPSDTDRIRSTPIEPLAGLQISPGKSSAGRSGNLTVSSPSAGSPTPPARKKNRGGIYMIVAAVALGVLLLGGVPVILLLGQRDPKPVAKGKDQNPDTSGVGDEVTPPIDTPPITKIKPPDTTTPAATTTTPQPAPPETPTTAHQFTPPSVTPGQWHDMLPIVDVKLDKLWGDWTMVSGALEASPPPGWMEKNAPRNANLVLPVAPQGEYQLRLKLQFTEGDQVAIISLPVEKRQAMFSIRGKTGERTKAGFEKLGNKRIEENTSRTTIIQPRLGTVHQLDLIVIPHGGIAQLYALWDGKPASHWTGPLDQIAPIEEFAVPGEPSIGLATSGTVARFPSVYLGVISGNLRHFRELGQLLIASGSPDENPSGTNPASTNPSFTPPAGTNPLPTVGTALPPEGIDLLKLADGTKYAVKGAWKMNGGALECSQSSGGALLEIPVHPPEHYRVELVAERTAGNDGLGLALVSKFTQFAVGLDAIGGTKAILSRIDGIGGAPENPTLTDRATFAPGRVVRLRYEVHPGRVHVLADDKTVIDWKGDFSRLSIDSAYYNHKDRSALAISAKNSVFRIYEARLLPLDAPSVTGGPDAAAVAAAVAALQQQFAAEYEAAKKPEQKVTLAQSLLEEARNKSAEPAVQVALWEEARRLAVEGGDYQLALASLQARNARFPLNYLEEAAKLLEPISLPATKRTENLAIATLASDLLEQAIEKDQLDTALKLGLAAQNAIKKLADRDLTKAITDRLIEARAMQAETAKIADSLAAVAAGTAAPADLLVVGRYQCFVKNDWTAGLANLAAGSDPKLQDLAKKDLAGAKTAATRMLVADQWYEIATKLPRDDRKPLLRHAAEWYIQALPMLTGTQRTTAVSRVHEAALTRLTTAPTVLAQGLVACWSFDEGRGNMAQDSVGKNHAYVNRATWTQGVSGGALHFDAPDQYALVPSGAALPAWTISMWVRQTRSPNREGGLFMTQSLRTGHVHFFLQGDNVITARVEDFIGGSGGNFPLNEWHHVAATQSGGRVTVFMDGSEKGQGNAAGNAPRVPGIIGPARIGSWYDDDPTRSLHAAIDEVRIYNRVLADQEILLLAQPPQ